MNFRGDALQIMVAGASHFASRITTVAALRPSKLEREVQRGAVTLQTVPNITKALTTSTGCVTAFVSGIQYFVKRLRSGRLKSLGGGAEAELKQICFSELDSVSREEL